MKTFISRFVLMLQFLTVLPLPFKPEVRKEDLGRGLVFAPLAGMVIGGILCGVYFISSLVFPVIVSSVIVIAAYAIVTGGLHLDGLGDTFDGLFSGRPRPKMLEIMRDSRIGTNALLSVTLVLFINISCIASLPVVDSALPLYTIILLMPAAGRMGCLLAAGTSVYAREGEGTGRSFVDNCKLIHVISGALIFFAIAFLLAGINGLLLALASMTVSWLLTKVFSRKIGGVTGDILGAVCELTQAAFLMLSLLFKTYAILL